MKHTNRVFILVVFCSLIWFLGDISMSKRELHAQEGATTSAKSKETSPFPITYGQVCSSLLKQKKPQILLDSVPAQKEIDAINKNKNACIYLELKEIPSDFEIKRINLIPHVCVVMHLSSPVKSHDLKRLPKIETPCTLLEMPTPPTSHEVGYLNNFKGCVSLMLSQIPDHYQVSNIKKMSRGCVVQQLASPIKDQDIDRLNKLPCLFTEFTNIPTSRETDILEQLAQDPITENSCAFITAWRSRSLCFTPAPAKKQGTVPFTSRAPYSSFASSFNTL